MRLVPLELVCRKCGSADITYSCEPKCCFSHVCGNCYFQFWPVTSFTGEEMAGVEPPPGEKDCLLPTTECARCHSLNVCSLASPETFAPMDRGKGGSGLERGHGTFVCADCRAILSLEYSEEAPA